MKTIGILDRFFNKSVNQTRFEMVTERGNGFYAWNGKIYQSDIVRACIHPKVKAIGKLVGKHIRETIIANGKNIAINPEAYLRFILEEPNPYMTGQMLQEKMAAQLCLNNNAFALIIRDDFGYPAEIYPIPANGIEAIYDKQGNLYLKCYFKNGKYNTFPYSDIIHLRQDFNENDIFGDSLFPALAPLMEIVATTDQGIVKAIKNSNVIQWLLKFNTSTRPEDLKKNAEQFVENYMNIDSAAMGVAAVDTKAEAVRVEPREYVPNALQMEKTTQRIYSLFNTNDNIVQSKYTEDQWNSYYEAEIEPTSIQMTGEYTRKIFSRRERGFGNYIVFEASNLQCASISTKLNLLQMVDRGAMTPNEWRAVMNLAPVDGGDVPIRRLDTAVVNQASALISKMNGVNDAAILALVDKLMCN